MLNRQVFSDGCRERDGCAASRSVLRSCAIAFLACALIPCGFIHGQQSNPSQRQQQNEFQTDAESELQTGTDLTQRGKFGAAIPHLVAARGHVANEYAASFNLALCYVATGQPKLAVPILQELQKQNSAAAAVWNLSA